MGSELGNAKFLFTRKSFSGMSCQQTLYGTHLFLSKTGYPAFQHAAAYSCFMISFGLGQKLVDVTSGCTVSSIQLVGLSLEFSLQSSIGRRGLGGERWAV